MNLKKCLAVIVALIGLSFFTIEEASASTTNTTNLNEDDFLSQVKVYDDNNNLIPYTLEELRELIKFETNDSSFKDSNLVTPSALQRTYNTGKFSFLNFIYINNGNKFKNPIDILITPDGVAKPFTVKIQSTTGGRTIDFPGGWVGGTHVALTGLPRTSYSFQFVNNSSSRNYMKDVRIIYEW